MSFALISADRESISVSLPDKPHVFKEVLDPDAPQLDLSALNKALDYIVDSMVGGQGTEVLGDLLQSGELSITIEAPKMLLSDCAEYLYDEYRGLFESPGDTSSPYGLLKTSVVGKVDSMSVHSEDSTSFVISVDLKSTSVSLPDKFHVFKVTLDLDTSKPKWIALNEAIDYIADSLGLGKDQNPEALRDSIQSRELSITIEAPKMLLSDCAEYLYDEYRRLFESPEDTSSPYGLLKTSVVDQVDFMSVHSIKRLYEDLTSLDTFLENLKVSEGENYDWLGSYRNQVADLKQALDAELGRGFLLEFMTRQSLKDDEVYTLISTNEVQSHIDQLIGLNQQNSQIILSTIDRVKYNYYNSFFFVSSIFLGTSSCKTLSELEACMIDYVIKDIPCSELGKYLRQVLEKRVFEGEFLHYLVPPKKHRFFYRHVPLARLVLQYKLIREGYNKYEEVTSRELIDIAEHINMINVHLVSLQSP